MAYAPWENRFASTGSIQGNLLRQGACFDPATALIIASTAVSAVGAISAGNAQAASLKSQANALEYNASVQRMNADRTAAEYSVREDQQRRQQAIILGRQRAGIAESGIGFTGTALDLEEQSNINAELDNLTLRYEGNTQRAALLQDATMSTYQAGAAKSQAKSAKQQGYISALGSVLGGAGRYYQSQSALSSASSPTAGGKVVGQAYTVTPSNSVYTPGSISVRNLGS